MHLAWGALHAAGGLLHGWLDAAPGAGGASGPLADSAAHAGRLARRLLADAHPEGSIPPHEMAIYIVVIVFLVISAGLMAGLTLGLLSLDKVDLEVVKRSGTPKEQWLVGQVEPVLARPHYLLATLLLCNAAAMEALPIFLDRLVNPVAAIAISVTAILIFGEIIPQAVCKRFGLQVGAYLAWPVRILMLITGIVTYPIGKLLDWILGEESALFRRHELKALVTLHAEPQSGDEEEPALTQDEVTVIQGALDMATKTAQSAMTPVEKVFMLSTDDVINLELLHRVINAGHSRLPVYGGTDKQDILGLILVKELVLVDETAGVRVRDLRLREVPFIRADIPLYEALKMFRMGRSHMAFLTRVTSELPPAPPDGAADGRDPSASAAVAAAGGGVSGTDAGVGGGGGTAHGGGAAARTRAPFFKPSMPQQEPEEVIGLITIEDVLEELLQAEILDETDAYVDNMQTIKANTLVSMQALPASLRRFLTGSSMTAQRRRKAAGAAAASGAAASAAAATAAAATAAAATASAPVSPLHAGAAAAAPAGGPAGGAAGSAAAAGGGGLQPLQTQAPERPALGRSASAKSLGAAATAGVIHAALAEGGRNPTLIGAAAASAALAAGHISAAQGQHPLGGSPQARPATAPSATGGSASAPINIRKPGPGPANIPRRGGGGGPGGPGGGGLLSSSATNGDTAVGSPLPAPSGGASSAPGQ